MPSPNIPKMAISGEEPGWWNHLATRRPLSFRGGGGVGGGGGGGGEGGEGGEEGGGGDEDGSNQRPDDLWTLQHFKMLCDKGTCFKNAKCEAT